MDDGDGGGGIGGSKKVHGFQAFENELMLLYESSTCRILVYPVRRYLI
jgi:hypothetical protein